jgi:cellulose synthase/poly-beta-1,6-N-acetylglucosamine synthase-like glycosyltransferase
MLALLLVSVGVIGYVYAGYPALLWLIVRLRGARPIHRADISPRVSLVISAFNEAHVIRQKLDNALALRYPRERLEIVVVSDASDDGTDEIVQEYEPRGVRLFRQPERGGKTRGLNAVLPTLSGEIVVFSDANAMYRPDALAMLVRNFADPEVGCVTGEAQYTAGDGAAADRGERVYWDYEIQIKRLETAVGSMVGGDGAIYAIRHSLWRPLPENAINDFLNPLQIVAEGWRGVYEPQAVCFEETAGAARSEYKRRVRIVSRSWRAVFQARQALNPLRTGFSPGVSCRTRFCVGSPGSWRSLPSLSVVRGWSRRGVRSPSRSERALRLPPRWSPAPTRAAVRSRCAATLRSSTQLRWSAS